MDDQFALEAMLRLPLAQATLEIWRWIATGDLLAEVFDEHRGRSSERVICFATVVQLMADALVRHQGNAWRSFEQAIADGSLEASVQAAYGPLRRVPVEGTVPATNAVSIPPTMLRPAMACGGRGESAQATIRLSALRSHSAAAQVRECILRVLLHNVAILKRHRRFSTEQTDHP